MLIPILFAQNIRLIVYVRIKIKSFVFLLTKIKYFAFIVFCFEGQPSSV